MFGYKSAHTASGKYVLHMRHSLGLIDITSYSIKANALTSIKMTSFKKTYW